MAAPALPSTVLANFTQTIGGAIYNGSAPLLQSDVYNGSTSLLQNVTTDRGIGLGVNSTWQLEPSVGSVNDSILGDVLTGNATEVVAKAFYSIANVVRYKPEAASRSLSPVMDINGANEFWENSSSLAPFSWFNYSMNSTVPPDVDEAQQPHALWEIILISVVVTILSLITAGGNLMVIISFKLDKQLQTISNYFLLSLSVADFAIGVFSMPLYTLYLLMKRWPLGAVICDTWLSLDYTMSNASVANLLLISFDRYLSVTRPLTYRANRTPRRAGIMITCAWVISAVMWTPWIIAWPYIEGKRTVQVDECQVQFLTTNPYITVITAVAAFYLPVFVMCVLYFKIYLTTERRQKDLSKLQAGKKKDYKKAHDSSDEDVYVNLNRGRLDSSPDADVLDAQLERVLGQRRRWRWWYRIRNCCRIDKDNDGEESSSSGGPASPHHYSGTPSSSQPGNNGGKGKDPFNNHVHGGHGGQGGKVNGKDRKGKEKDDTGLLVPLITVDSNKSTPTCTPSTEVTGTSFSRHTSGLSTITDRTLASPDEVEENGGPASKKIPPKEDTYTILIKLPESRDRDAKPTIQMIAEEDEDEDGDDDEDDDLDEDDEDLEGTDSHPEGESIPMTRRVFSSEESELETPSRTLPDGPMDESDPNFPSVGRRLTQTTDALRLAMQARIAARLTQRVKAQRARRKRQEKKQDKKAAKTLSAILLAFVITWTPYNVFTVIVAFCSDCVDPTLYAIGESSFITLNYRNRMRSEALYVVLQLKC